MSLHFVLDGYNIIKQAPHLADLKLETAREALVRWVEKEKPHGSLRNAVTVVFDGQSGIVGSDRKGTFVKVVFSRGESADDKIKDIVGRAAQKRHMRVVTNDRSLQYHVRSLGAQVLSVGEFLGKVKSHQDHTFAAKKKTQGVSQEKDISRNLAYKITQELRDIWLGK